MRRAAPVALLAVGGLLALAAARGGPGTDAVSFFPLLELAGRAPQSAHRVAAHALGVTDHDEAALGNELDAAWSARDLDGPDRAYVEAVFARIAPHARKPFDYRLHVVDGPPNAMALPGGVILVTTGLLAILDDEAELAAVLAHELAHVELSHGLDAASFELAARKGGGVPARLAGVLNDLLLRHAYTKSQEAEADAWGFGVIVDSPYDPRAMADAFHALAQASPEPGGPPDPFRDYLRSHPPIALREATYRAQAEAWWAANPDASRTRGGPG